MKSFFSLYVAAALSAGSLSSGFAWGFGPVLIGPVPLAGSVVGSAVAAAAVSAAEAGEVATKAEAKPEVLVFTATWCSPCRVFKEKVLGSDEVKAVEGDFTWKVLDVDADENRALCDTLGVRAVPWTVVRSADGKVLASQVGVPTPAEYVKLLQGALVSP